MTEVLANTKDMQRDEWLMERRRGIGGSDASIILGLNKYKTPFELWLEKTNQSHVDEETPEAAHFGHKLEGLVADEFTERTGKKVRRDNRMFQHPDHDFIIANIDRKVVGENALLECKTASAYLKKEWEDEEIPEAYLVQIQHYLGVTEYEKAFVAVLIGGQRFIWKEVERDEELINMIFEAEKHFWEEHVLANVPPALDGSSAAEQYLKERYEQSEEKKTINLAHEYKEKIKQFNDLDKTIKQLEKERDAIKNTIKHELEDAEAGYVGEFEVLWRSHEKTNVDSKKLKQEFPDVYEKVKKKSVARPFKIKELV